MTDIPESASTLAFAAGHKRLLEELVDTTKHEAEELEQMALAKRQRTEHEAEELEQMALAKRQRVEELEKTIEGLGV